jgi:hypothetical protein
LREPLRWRLRLACRDLKEMLNVEEGVFVTYALIFETTLLWL